MVGRSADRLVPDPINHESEFRQLSPRPQFHYFYGSTTATTASTPNNNSRNHHHLAEDESNQQEHDSLVGEELVSTDTEADLLGSELPTSNGRNVKPGEVAKKANGDLGIEGPFDSNSTKINSFYGVCSLLVFVLIAGAMSTLVALLIPHSSDHLPQTETFTMPYEMVDRADFGDPVDGFLNLDLFHPSLLSASPATSKRAFIFPFPTGAFWTNLVVSSPIADLSYPIVVYPFAYRWSSTSLEVSYPARHRVADARTISDGFAPDLTLTTVEGVSRRHVTAFDSLSVTLRYVSSVKSKWESALVQGSPYVTLEYANETPILKPLSIFSMVQCPGDDEENFSDFDESAASTPSGGGGFDTNRRRLFGVCSLDVSGYEEADATLIGSITR